MAYLSEIFSADTFKRFASYCGIGFLNTAVDFGLYYVLTRMLPFGEFILFSKALSYIGATTFSFFMNRHWTFSKRNQLQFEELLKFYSTVGLGIFVNVGVHYGAVYVFSLSDIVGVFIAAGFTALWGFSFARFYVFKK